jgi:phosphoglycerol transferase MdoB-like AlkP superfamily enzyme
LFNFTAMLKVLIFFIRFFLLWLLFFFTDRLLFLLSNSENVHTVGFSEIFGTFYHSTRLDIAMIAYMAVIPFIVIFVQLFFKRRTVKISWLKIYNWVLIVICCIISVINLNIYHEWGSKINAKAVDYAFSAPNEALASTASSPIAANLCILVLLIALGGLLTKILPSKDFIAHPASLIAKTGIFISAGGILFLMMRGGLGVSPNNQSMAYFSDRPVLNHAAVNTEWNLMSSLLKSGQISKNPYQYYNDYQAERSVRAMYKSGRGNTAMVLNTKKPNVVLIIMESFTADLTDGLGAEKGITPVFDSLAADGLLFSRIYATGNRTDKGIIGSLAAQPSLAAENMVKWPDKLEKIPSISQVLYRQGYYTSFYYGGQSEFDNYKVFVMSHKYQELIDKSSFPVKDMNSKWGAYDGTVLTRQLADLNKTRQPFFSTIMTLTNHEPFEVPGSYKFGKKNNTERFKSTAFYTDSCIGAYLAEAKKQAWYSNTLFIFIADHGHILPKGREAIYIPQRYHIPLLFYGEVIKKEYRGRKIGKTGSQIDLAATLLNQMGLDAGRFRWSKNLLHPGSPDFAFFSWDNGIGFIDNKQCVTFDNVGKMVLYNDYPKDKKTTGRLLQSAKSFIQAAYHQFLLL